MKKTLFITLASIALVSCSQDETVATMDRVAIEFDKVFLENSTSTRAADITTANLTNFAVYGSVVKGEQKGNIFNEQEVSGTEAAGYTYSPAQYWIPGADYYFTAIAPLEIAPNEKAAWTYTCLPGDVSEYGTRQAHYGTITFDNGKAEANQDLLWAYQSASTQSTNPDAVTFSFQHMLSRAKFTFVNDFEVGSNISLKVKAVTIKKAHQVGTIELQGTAAPAKQWSWEGSETNPNTFDKLFGDTQQEAPQAPQTSASTAHYYLLPVANASYELEFTIELYQAGVLLQTIEKKSTITVPTMERGYSYEFKAKLNANNTTNDGSLEAIEFKVTGVQDWGDYKEVTANIQTSETNQ